MTDFKDKLINAKDKIVGEVKEAVGKATGNEELELKGKLQSTKADFNEKVAEIKDGIVDKVNDVYDSVVDDDKKVDLQDDTYTNVNIGGRNK
jgi:uncharacterized protein YjbJ (UPF0337 family)